MDHFGLGSIVGHLVPESIVERLDPGSVGNYFDPGSIVEHLVSGGVMEHHCPRSVFEYFHPGGIVERNSGGAWYKFVKHDVEFCI